MKRLKFKPPKIYRCSAVYILLQEGWTMMQQYKHKYRIKLAYRKRAHIPLLDTDR